MIFIVLAWIAAVNFGTQVVADVQHNERHGDHLAADSTDEPLAALHSSRFRYVGSHSCMSTACHGNVPVDRAFSTYSDAAYKGLEYRFWFEKDPHARAHNTLASDSSRKILTSLLGDVGMRTRSTAHYQNCEACHGLNPARTNRCDCFADGDRGMNSVEAVGCESCHGPAEAWLAIHHTPVFRTLTAHEKSGLGMINTKNLKVRAALCADCHVGSASPQSNGQPARQVTHDMIAAGHPVLRFELSAYHDCLPKHWDHLAERAAKDDFQQQLWAHGSIASGQSALQLLRFRATHRNEGVSVWPEFSEFSCTACHSPLPSTSTRAQFTIGGANGRIAFGQWNYSHLPAARMALTGRPTSELNNYLENIRESMGSTLGRSNDALDMRLVDSINRAYGLLQSVPTTNYLCQSIPNVLRNHVTFADEIDAATQNYLALIAFKRDFDHAAGKPANVTEAKLESIRSALLVLSRLRKTESQDGTVLADINRSLWNLVNEYLRQ